MALKHLSQKLHQNRRSLDALFYAARKIQPMSGTGDTLQAARFFIGFLPSFTNLGYLARRALWQQEVWDFSGQHWLVTGASTGIGREIARQAAAAGADVLAVARSAEKLAALASEAENLPGSIHPIALDLSLVASTEQLIDHALAQRPGLNVLINNVGVLLNTPSTTIEGLDTGFATNLLNPWLLTNKATERGLLTAGASIINMSSGGMYNVPLSVAALESHDDYQGALAYAHHKRAQVELNAYLRRIEKGRRQHYVMHPGWVDTPGVETSLPDFHRLLKPFLRNVPAGADTALWLAARRPDQRSPEGIWFDRALRAVHALPGSRQGDDIETLLAYLQTRCNISHAK